MALKVVSARERPDLVRRADSLDVGFHEYNLHGDVLEPLWPLLFERFPGCQLALFEDSDETVLGAGNTIPCAWSGTVEGLPAGIDAVLERGFAGDGESPNTLSALLIKIAPGHAGQGLSRLLLGAMRELAGRLGFADLIAPVRPNWKDRYPLTPIEEYARWTRQDGLPFDPWMRVHSRLGADLLAVAPESLRISGPVDEWERWIGLPLPASGLYVIPGGLAPLRVDREADLGLYFEPNVWMRHGALAPS